MFSPAIISLPLLALVTLANAQASSSPTSTNPLAGVPTSTGFFQPDITFTPVTTFQTAETRVPTTLVGNGPSGFTAPYSFPYDLPLSPIAATVPSALMESLKSAGFPTDAAGPLIPPMENLQIVNPGNTDAASTQQAKTLLAAVLAGVVGAGVMLL